MISKILNLIHDDSGATAIEYGLIAGLISIVIIVALGIVGSSLDGTFSNIASFM